MFANIIQLFKNTYYTSVQLYRFLTDQYFVHADERLKILRAHTYIANIRTVNHGIINTGQ